MGFWDLVGSRIGTLLLITSTIERVVPNQVWYTVERFFQKVLHFFNPYVEIAFEEFPSECYGRSKAYSAIQTYLGANFSLRADRLRARIGHESKALVLSMDDYQEITDVYRGISVTWLRNKSVPRSNIISIKGNIDEKRAYILSFRRKHSEIITGPYLNHVLTEGKAARKRSRRQRLYTNVSGEEWGSDDKMMWQCAAFEHPATFDTLAMDPGKKKGIMEDLVEFTKAREYYRSIGKAWKRGYLLYGPPGTGKSTMIAAMANFLHYDVYDLELTAVRDNTQLRKLMMEISKRAIVVIEDIDCSLHITGKRKAKNSEEKGNSKKDVSMEEVLSTEKSEDYDNSDDGDADAKAKKSKVTLSGLLNFMDGLWSASGGERIFVFTTNHLDKIDDALVRRGRMDKHVEMSYCCFESFRVLARNYLRLERHEKFEAIRQLLAETEISPADVAENLMPTSAEMGADACLENLIGVLRKGKEGGEKGEGKELEEIGEIGRGKVGIWGNWKGRIKGLLGKQKVGIGGKKCVTG